jgi:hypothetical protein
MALLGKLEEVVGSANEVNIHQKFSMAEAITQGMCEVSNMYGVFTGAAGKDAKVILLISYSSLSPVYRLTNSPPTPAFYSLLLSPKRSPTVAPAHAARPVTPPSSRWTRTRVQTARPSSLSSVLAALLVRVAPPSLASTAAHAPMPVPRRSPCTWGRSTAK